MKKTHDYFEKNKTRHYLGMKEKLEKEYGLDILKDVILSEPNKVILFLDLNNPKGLELEVLTGTLKSVGFEEKSSIKLTEILDHFDYGSGYAKVAGEESYFSNIKKTLFDFKNSPDVTFPIKRSQERHWLNVNVVSLSHQEDIATFFITDVTDLLAEEEKLFIKTHHDSLTGVFNKYTLDYHYGKRYKYDDFHVMFLDLDNFKQQNDLAGHKEGNAFLAEFGNLLKSYESNFNRFYRIGGDEFVGFFFEKPEKVKSIASDIVKKTKTLSHNDLFKKTTVSIGVVQAEERNDVIVKADNVLYKVKQSGKNDYLYMKESEIEENDPPKHE